MWAKSLSVSFFCLVTASFASDAVITNQLAASLTIIDADRLRIKGEIKGVGGYPAGIGYCGESLFVISSPDDATISLIDSESLKVVKQWSIGTGPLGIDCHQNTAVIADWYENAVYKLDLNSGDIDKYAVGMAPSGVLISAINDTLYVANRDEDSVYVLEYSTGEILYRLQTGDAPFGLGIDAINNRLFVVNVRSANVSVFDLTTYEPIRMIDVGDWAYCITFNEQGTRGFVTNQDDDTVSVIDLHSLEEIDRYDVGLAPEGIAIYNDKLWVVNWQEASVSVLDDKDGTLIEEFEVAAGARSYGRFISVKR